MPYTSSAFEDAKGYMNPIGSPLPVLDVMATSKHGFWRYMAWARLVIATRLVPLFLLMPYVYPLVFFWISWYIFSRWIPLRSNLGAEDDPNYRYLTGILRTPHPGREIFLRVVLKFIMATRISWALFWRMYYLFGNPLSFHEDYLEAWKQKGAYGYQQNVARGVEYSLVLFFDTTTRLEVPCPSQMNDGELVQLLKVFYYFQKAELGLFGVLGMKSLELIEIAELKDGSGLGPHVSTLQLGRYRAAARQVYYFRDPSQLQESILVDELRAQGVFTERGQQTKCLNFVSRWDTMLAGTMVAIPIVFSLVFSITWSIVAVRAFGADVQTSTQTGFTIGSYIVTAGALLIALVAFLDSRYEERM